MPKEIVLSHESSVVNEAGIPIPVATQGLVQVGWHNEIGCVQIVTFSRDPVTHDERWQGLYVDLDRRGINDLIRHLRRARDQAFGRDE